LARAAHAFAIAADDHFEIAVDERVLIEEPLAVDDESRVRVARQVLRPVIKADPGGRHRVGVDVVEQSIHAEVCHVQVDLAARLPLCLSARAVASQTPPLVVHAPVTGRVQSGVGLTQVHTKAANIRVAWLPFLAPLPYASFRTTYEGPNALVLTRTELPQRSR